MLPTGKFGSTEITIMYNRLLYGGCAYNDTNNNNISQFLNSLGNISTEGQ